jgi:hypothetical protein
MLVLDRSGSMDDPSGIPGKKRIDVLHDAAPTFVELLGDTDGIGVVAFDQDASLQMAPVQAGPLGFGNGRVLAKSAIANHLTNLAGSTSIGDGVELAHDTLAGTSGYDRRAVVVFTDGEENTAKFIADIASKIDDRVYAIGLGTVGELNPVALSKLVENTGGYLMLTGALDASEQFRVAKYYLQILSGVVNSQIVVDPDGYIAPGQVVRIPFDLTEADTSTDVVLLSPWRKYIDFRVETPTGDLIDAAAAASLVDSAFVPGASLDAYRLSLPAIWPTHSAHAGRWYAHLQIGDARTNPSVSSYYREDDAGRSQLVTHGVPFSVSVQAQSSLAMSASAAARHAVPPATIDHRVTLRQLDIPLDTPCWVSVEATDPNGVSGTTDLTATSAGAFAIATDAPVAGVYTFHYIARGTSFAGVPFTREQVRTVGVWAGGGDPPPRSGSADGKGCCQDVIACLLEDRGVQELLKRYEIDARRIIQCLARHERKG